MQLSCHVTIITQNNETISASIDYEVCVHFWTPCRVYFSICKKTAHDILRYYTSAKTSCFLLQFLLVLLCIGLSVYLSSELLKSFGQIFMKFIERVELGSWDNPDKIQSEG